jgi:putative transposase
MRTSKFSEEQIVQALRQAEAGTPVVDICRTMEITETTFYRSKKKYFGLGVSELREMKLLREENRKLKGLVADLTLDKQILRESLTKNSRAGSQTRVGAVDRTRLCGVRAARVQLARVLSMTGRHAEAMKALPPDSIRLGSYEAGIAGFVYARAGQRTAALAAARGLERRDVVPAEGVAAIYAALGDKDRAIACLEKAVALRGVGLIFLGVEPMYDGLRGDRRFTDVLNQIGVVY